MAKGADMSVTIVRTPHFVLRRAVAVLALIVIVAAIVAATVQAGQPKVHAQLLPSGTVQVSGYDGGAPLAPAGR